MFDWIVNQLAAIFQKLHDLIVNMGVTDVGTSYVLAIFIFTLAIRLLILPLNIKSAKSTQKMQEIQPELKKIQKKYANDPQKLQMETSRLMKESGASYMGSCLPMLLPLPILFALYYVFRAIDSGDQVVSFLWITDLFGKNITNTGSLFGNLGNLMTNPLNLILPILAGLSTYLPSLLMSKATAQSSEDSPVNMGSMNIFMSGMMVFMSLNFPPILVIYWIIGGMIQLVQTYFLQYRPAMKRAEEKSLREAELAATRSKKATPKKK